MNFEEFTMSNFWESILSLFGVTSLATTCRTIMTPELRNFKMFLLGIPLSFFVGIFMGSLIWDMNSLTQWQKFGVMSMCSYVAPSILLAVSSFATLATKDPLKLIINYLLKR